MYKSILILSLLYFSPTISLFSQGKVTLTFSFAENTNIYLQKTDNHLILNYQEVPLEKQDKTDQNTYVAQIEKADYYRLFIGDKTFGLHLQAGFSYQIEVKKNRLKIYSEDILNQTLYDREEKYNELSTKYIRFNGARKSGYEQALHNFVAEEIKFITNSKLTEYAKSTLEYNLITYKSDNLKNTEAFYQIVKKEILPEINLENKEYVKRVGSLYESKANFFNLRESKTPPQPNPTLYFLDEANFITKPILKQFIELHLINEILYGSYGNINPDFALIEKTIINIINNSEKPIISDMANSLLTKIKTLKRGNTIKDLSLPIYNKQKIQLRSLTGKVVVLDFWYTGCKPCIEAIPEIKALIAEHEKDLVFISIDPVDTEERFLKMVQKKDMNWTHILTTKDDPISEYFNVGGYPTYIVIDKEGNFYGDYTSKNFIEAVKELLP